DAHGLPHLLHPDRVPVVGVAILRRGNVKLVLFVAGVWLRLAEVPFHAGSPQHRAGHAVILALLGVQDTDSLQAAHPDTVVGKQFLVFVYFGEEHVAKGAALLFESVVGLVQQPADAEGMSGQARSAVILEDLENFFALAETIKDWCDGADIERMSSQ